MISEQREALNDIIGKIRTGRMTRRNFIERAIAVGLSSTAAVSLLEACGGGTDTGTSSNGKATVNLYHTIPTSTETYWKENLLTVFAKKNPNVTLVPYQLGVEDPTVIRSKIKAGGSTAPDMAWLASTETGAYVQANLVPDVDGWLNKHPDLKNNIFPSLVTLSSFQGKVQSLPWMTNNTAMWINLDAFNAAKVPVPSQDPEKTWTWDEFADACKKLSALKGMKGFLMHNGGPGWDAWLFHAWLGANGGEFLSSGGDASFANAAGQETMSFLQSLVKNGYTTYSAPNKGYDPSGWYTGKAAITANGPWNFPDLVKFKTFKFSVVPYPRNKKPATNTGGNQLFVFNRNQQNVDASLAYAEYMLSDDFQIAFNIQSGNLPVTQTATKSAQYQDHLKQYPFLAGWVNGVPYGVARSSLPQANDVQTAFGQTAWDPIILQGADVKQSLAKAADKANSLKP